MARVLIHIGYRKAASTFIKDWLTNHPNLLYNNFRIGGFSNTYELVKSVNQTRNNQISYYTISDNFTLYRNSAKQKNKENIQSYQLQSCKLLRQLFTDAKILIITRAPETAIVSEYNELLKNGNHFSSEELLKMDLSKSYFSGIYDYNFLINLYYEHFGRKNVIVLPYELLKDNPTKFISHIEDSLQLAHFEYIKEPINRGLSPNDKYWYLKISKFIFALCRPFGKAGQKVYDQYRKWLGYKSDRKNKLKSLVWLLTLLNGKQKEKIEIPQDLLKILKEKATILNEIEVYHPYANQYYFNAKK
jgi:hypothetical protein